MIILHTKKLIFIHVHRTGGTSFSNILRQNLDDNVEIFSQHSNAMSLSTDLIDYYNDYYKFGFTRNPWERIFSWYSLIQLNNQISLVEERMRFEKFIECDHASDFSSPFFHYNSLDYFTNEKGRLLADKIYRYEDFNNEIRTIVNKFNLQLTAIPHVNVASPKDYKAYYTDKSRNLIALKCKKDIEFFNYTF
jgi:hypothetical protein